MTAHADEVVTNSHEELDAPFALTADQIEFYPLVRIAVIMKQLLGPPDVDRSHIKAVGHEQIQKAVKIVIGYRHAVASTGVIGHGSAY